MLEFLTGDFLNGVMAIFFKGATFGVILYKMKWLVVLFPMWKLYSYIMNRFFIRIDGRMDYGDMEDQLAGNQLALATLWSGRLQKRGIQRAGWSIADALFIGFVLIA